MKIPKDTPMSGEGHEILLELLDAVDGLDTVDGEVEHLNHINVKDSDFFFIDVFNIRGELIVSIGLCDGHSSEAKIVRL